MTGESKTLQQLRGVAAKLTADFDLQKDLLQEMLIHLCRVEVDKPGRTPSWYVKSCEFHARNYLKLGRSVNSLKRARNLIPLGDSTHESEGHVFCFFDAVDPQDDLAELVTRDILELVMPQLTETQQEILYLLMKGLGVREIARELQMTHPAVIKHRRKIAHIAGPLLELKQFAAPATMHRSPTAPSAQVA
jgi:RNA polymerase sigma factor (sigma-70 family)